MALYADMTDTWLTTSYESPALRITRLRDCAYCDSSKKSVGLIVKAEPFADILLMILDCLPALKTGIVL